MAHNLSKTIECLYHADPDSKKVSSKTVPILLVLLLSFSVYINAITAGIFLDDIPQLLQNKWITDIRYLADIFGSSVLGFQDKIISQYRPMMHVFYMLCHYIGGKSFWLYHLINILIHVAVTILVYLISCRLFLSSKTQYPFALSLVTACIYAVHPIHTEAVTWIGALPEVSYSLFFLLSFYLYITNTNSRISLQIFSAVAFFISCLCKEPGVTLPLVLVFYDVLIARHRSYKHYLKSYAIYAFFLLVYFLLRFKALKSLTPAKSYWDLDTYQSLLNVPPLILQYIIKLSFPVGLNTFHIFHPVTEATDTRFIYSTAILTVAFILLIWFFKSQKLLLFSIALMAVPMLPAFYIPAFGITVFGERYLYLPSFGFIIFVVLIAQQLAFKYQLSRVVITVAVSAVLLIFAVATIRRNMDWQDDLSIWSDTVSKSPDGATPRVHLAYALFTRGRLDEALYHYEAAVKLDPKLHEAHANLGNIYCQKKNFPKALEHYTAAINTLPDNPDYLVGLAYCYETMGKHVKALEYLKNALQLAPGFIDARLHLGTIYGNQGMTDEAMREFQHVLRLDPGNKVAQDNLRLALEIKNRGH